MRSARVLIAAGLAAGLLAAGCGDDDDDGGEGTTTAAAPLTKQQFIAQADAICAAGDKEIDTQGQQTFGKGQPTPDELNNFTTTILAPGIQKQIDGVAALSPPEAEKAQVDAFLSTAQKELDAVKADPSVIANEKGPSPFAETEKLAAQLGLKKCAQG